MKVQWPHGASDVVVLTYAATIALAITNSKTFASVAMTGAATLNITPDANLKAGAQLVLTIASDATARDLTPGTSMTGTVVSGIISKTKVATYDFDGTNFIHTGTQQIN